MGSIRINPCMYKGNKNMHSQRPCTNWNPKRRLLQERTQVNLREKVKEDIKLTMNLDRVIPPVNFTSYYLKRNFRIGSK